MSTHYSSFTPEGMTRLADMLRADEDNRREFCTNNRHQTQQLMGQFHSERQAAGSMRKRERSQFLDELRAGGQRFREQCAATGRERAGQLRDLACQNRAAAEAFHGARRAQRA
jgi:hypothetical protein